MFQEVKSESEWFKFWEDEQSYPRWYRDASRTWTPDRDAYLAFCRSCLGIYGDEGTLIYVESDGDLHIAYIRKGQSNAESFISLRYVLFQHFSTLYGWVYAHHRRLKKLLVDLGFHDTGVRMYKGQSHGKVLQWNLYVANRENSGMISTN